MSRRVSLSLKTARALLSHFEGCAAPGFYAFEAELRAAMEPKRSVVAARSRKEERRLATIEETKRIRAAVVKRARGFCELCAATGEAEQPGSDLHHALGRNVPQSERNCLFVCRACHRDLTDNKPNAAYWLNLQERIFEGLGYRETAGALVRRLGMVQAKAELSRKEAAP